MIHYTRYSDKGESINHKELCELNQKTQDYLARAENSGCEGCYVEIARWSYDRLHWERFAFMKFLGGEDRDREDWAVDVLAEFYTDEINNAAGPGQRHLALIHKLPDWKPDKPIRK